MQNKKSTEPTPEQNEMIEEAFALHHSGQLDLAEIQYKKLLIYLPTNVSLLTMLGTIALQRGRLEDAVRIIGKSLQIDPNQTDALNNRGNALRDLKRLDEALVSYDRAIALKPDYAYAHSNRGNILKDLKRLDEALISYDRAITLNPKFSEAYYNRSNTLKDLKRLDEALASYDRAITLNPDYAEAYSNRGITLEDLSRLDEALASYDCAITLNPDYAEAYYNRGNTLQNLKRLNEALASYDRAIALNPDYAKAYSNRGITLKDLSRLDEALASYDRAIALNPDYVYAYSNRGNALQNLKRLDEALASYDRAIALNPDYAEAYSNRGSILQDLKRLDEALLSYDRAMALKEDIDFIFGISLHTRMRLCIWENLSNDINKLTYRINNGEKVSSPFNVLTLIDDSLIHRRTSEIYVNEKYSQSNVLKTISIYRRHKKIRIGYFSGDFRNHPVSYLTAELYETHDRNKFEVYAFSYGPDVKDEMHFRIQNGVDHFQDIRDMSDKDAATLARSVEIDIAVDLGGFTRDSRTGIFAMSAAPIQLSYIGYLGTMGANYYDYLLADQTIIPENNKEYYSEKIVYLPSYQVNDSKKGIPDTIFTREDIGLPEEGFVFCCFNNTYKITPTIFDGWVRILKQVEGSVLLLLEDNETAKINLTRESARRGIPPSRLIFGKRLPMTEYLARYRIADLFLDTLPYNAGTTASDALGMGLPVLTCMGNSFASRVGASLLNAVNLPELITTTQEQYESLAIQLALQPEKLKIIRDKLINNLPTAPLYDTPLFTRHLESAYLTMYDRYQHGLDPDHIYV